MPLAPRVRGTGGSADRYVSSAFAPTQPLPDWLRSFPEHQRTRWTPVVPDREDGSVRTGETADLEIAWPLSDSRLTIRPASVADADAFFEYQRRPEGQRYISRIPATIEGARAMVAERSSTAGELLCAIVVDGQVVGDIGGRRYRPGSLGPEPQAWDFRLGYSVHPGMWGKGVASGAVALLVPALHHQAGIRRIVAKVFADNQASIRVLVKNGFRLEGTERAAVLGRDGGWLDDCTLAHLS